MDVNERKKRIAAQRRREALIRKKKQQQKRLFLMLSGVLGIIILAIILLLVLPSSSTPDDKLVAQSTPEVTQSPEPTSTPVPAHIKEVNIHSASQEFSDGLPVFHCPEVTEKMIAITIDDCNEARNTQKIVDLAIRNNVKLTLFPIGNQLTSDVLQDALRTAFNVGFEIENHTMNHIYQDKLTNAEFYEDVLSQELAIRKVLGVDYKMNFLRLPGGNGEEDPRVHYYLKKLGYRCIADWFYSGTDADIYYIKKRIKPGAIYLFHTTDEDYQKLKEFIPYAISEGYQLVTLNELLGYETNAVYPYGTIENPQFDEFVYDEYIVMEKGMRATCIKHLQARLIELGYLPSNAVADGIFGAQTEEAITRFQAMHGLEGTGKADLNMQAILFSDAAKHAGF